MKINNNIMKTKVFMSALLCALAACSSSNDNDTTPPIITDEGVAACPSDCQVFKRGNVIPFQYVFTDDVELGNFNIEVHNNFDHHTHTTSAVECKADTIKTPVQPWVYNSDFDIPHGLKTYTAILNIDIPTDADAGDYHFMIRVTDKAGWQEIRSVAIRVE